MENQELIDKIIELIVTSAVTGVLSGVFLNGIATHMLYSIKLKKEQKVKFANSVGEKIANALIEVKKLVNYSETIEIFNAEAEMKKDDFDAFSGNVIYPAFMNEPQSLIDFKNMIVACRTDCEKYLDCGTALNLVFIERYIEQLMIYLSNFNDKRLMPALGTIFIADIQRWQRRCDKRVIKRINNQKYKLEYQNGYKWKIMRKWFVQKNWEKTILYALLNDKCKKKQKNHFEFIKQEIDLMRCFPERFISSN